MAFNIIFSGNKNVASNEGEVLNRSKWINKYSIVAVLNIIAVVLLFTPLAEVLMRPIIEVFLPKNIATLILPNWVEIGKAMKGNFYDPYLTPTFYFIALLFIGFLATYKFNKKVSYYILATFVISAIILPKWSATIDSMAATTCYKSFITYVNVMITDMKYYAVIAFIGFVTSFFISRKSGFYLIAIFIIPVILMSFILREPCHAKYLSFIYPAFIIAGSAGLYSLAFKVFPSFIKVNSETLNYSRATTVASLILFILILPLKEIKAMVTRDLHGNPVPKELSEISFVNWREPCEYIKENMQKGDLVMSTVIQAPQFYLDNDQTIWFRQMKYDAKVRKYVPNPPELAKNKASTYEALVATVKNNPRGWLLADYYFINALTDPNARQFCVENMTFHPDASPDGSVQVFSWDNSKPKQFQSPVLVELGKTNCFQGIRSTDPEDKNQYSTELSFNLNGVTQANAVQLVVVSENIDSDQEAFLTINDNTQVAITIPKNSSGQKIKESVINVDKSAFVEGANKIQFIYNGDDDTNNDNTKGFVIYNLNAVYK
ncbi:MAG: hypothetical protein H7321_01605 [Bacteroidia bacterium]|nr:hypothetical protein [Bacteroidia bacterium]